MLTIGTLILAIAAFVVGLMRRLSAEPTIDSGTGN
jgi:hypothetical protein